MQNGTRELTKWDATQGCFAKAQHDKKRKKRLPNTASYFSRDLQRLQDGLCLFKVSNLVDEQQQLGFHFF